jgi:hypothetical protein
MTKKYYNGKPINLSSSSSYIGAPTYKPKHKKILIRTIKSPKPTNPNHPDVMRETLRKTREGGYKGAKWLRK